MSTWGTGPFENDTPKGPERRRTIAAMRAALDPPQRESPFAL